jgi:hypothetical protein
VRLSEVSVGRRLRKLGLSPQCPLHRAYQRDEAKVAAWHQDAFPEIQKLAKSVGAQIYVGAEASVFSDAHRDTT